MAKRVSRCMKETKMLNMQISGVGVLSADFKIEGWFVAEFTVNKSDRKSVSGCEG